MLKMLYSPALRPGMTEPEARPHRGIACGKSGGGRQLNQRARLARTEVMMVFDFLKGEFIDVIDWTDDTPRQPWSGALNAAAMRSNTARN